MKFDKNDRISPFIIVNNELSTGGRSDTASSLMTEYISKNVDADELGNAYEDGPGWDPVDFKPDGIDFDHVAFGSIFEGGVALIDSYRTTMDISKAKKILEENGIETVYVVDPSGEERLAKRR